MSYYDPKWMAVLGIFVSIINGFSFPIFGLIFSKILFIMMAPMSPTFNEDRAFWLGMFLLESFVIAFVGYLQKHLFTHAGENLTFKIRKMLFSGIIYKQIAWFDRKERAPGVLSNILSEDINCLNGLTTDTISILLEAALGFLVGIILSLIYTWKMALITLAVTPLVALGAILMSRLQWNKSGAVKADNNNAKEEDPYTKSNALLSDILMNYRTVISFGEKNLDYLLN